MTRFSKLSRWFSLGLVLAGAPALRAQIDIGGVADKTVYSDQVTFTITNVAGFSFDARLDGSPVVVGAPVLVNRVDYHELAVLRTNIASSVVTNRLIRFIVAASERNGSENGLPPWTPYPMIPSAPAEFAGAHLRLVAPQDFPAGLPVPVVAWVENDAGHAVRVTGALTAPGQNAIRVLRGVGSGFLAADNPPGGLNYAPTVGGLTTNKTINLETNTAWTPVSGTLSGAVTWPENARIAVTNRLMIPAGASLTISAGAVVRLDSRVDIALDGSLTINGTVDRPVIFLPADAAQPWGGFMLHANTSQLVASGAIFTGSGAEPCWFDSQFCAHAGRPHSHRGEQALFSCSNSPSLTLSDSAAIYLAGQFSHAVNGGRFTFTRFLMQRCTTGGEFTGAAFTVNDSAFIECPDDTANFVDGDNDALYFVDGTHGFTNTLFGWTKDDGVDSGGSGAGLLNFQRCWFESIFHEGNSLSGTAKIVNHYDDVFLNCGQGLEAGYDGPVGTLAHCLATANLVGGRFGDNYNWSYSGFLRATNSLLLNNYHDVWGMNWQDWTYRTNAMDIRGNFLSQPNASHPTNDVWQPATDGWRLAKFMTTPADADVGVGFALRATQFGMDALTNALPVRLSSFTTNAVSVAYRVETPAAVLATGTVTFTPGETVKTIPAPGVPGADVALLRVQLADPVHAQLTGASAVCFARSAAPTNSTLVPAGSVWRYLDTGVDAGTAWRLPGYDDSTWLSGAAELGYGDGGEATVIRFGPSSSAKYITYYFRRAWVVTNAAAWGRLVVNLKRDDGGIVYLNGTEVFRSNLAPGPVDYLTRATLASDDGTVFYSTNAPAGLLVTGTNLLAVEIHQESPTSSDISFDLRLDAAPRPVLQPLRFGADWLVAWSEAAAVLEQADDPAGPWSVVAGASPVPIDTSAAHRFYRLRQP